MYIKVIENVEINDFKGIISSPGILVKGSTATTYASIGAFDNKLQGTVIVNGRPFHEFYDFNTALLDSNSIEKIMYNSGFENTFVDMKYQVKNKGNSWMFEKSKSSGWDGNNPEEEENLRNIFDGLILINHTSAPKYLKYSYEYFKN